MRKTILTIRDAAAGAAALVLLSTVPVMAQQAPVTITPGPQYESAPLPLWLMGENWRDLWTTPVQAPILDLGTFSGGLTIERQGGGNQSVTLHMIDPEQRGWVFRSIDKFPANNLPEEFRDAFLGRLIADQISTLHPGGHFVMPRLLEAVGILHVQPKLYVMPDDPRLGEFRETFAGMLGELEEKAEEGPDDTPGFAGSTKVKGSENFLDDLEDSPEFRLDAEEFLRARLVDHLVGDPDRGTDQWEWVRFGEEGDYVYRPAPKDRDWAFVHGPGLLTKLGRSFYPKVVTFEDEYAALDAYTYSSHFLDRRLLTELTRADFREAVAAVKTALTDEVIAEAVRDMPPEFVPVAADRMIATLRGRRDRLDVIATEWYDWLATEVDVRGTDEEDVADIERLPDGNVRVRLSSSAAPGGTDERPAVYYERVFLPEETNEVRVFLHGGDDRATVHGDGDDAILVRVIGGGGDDVLEDRAGEARFYDDRGENEFIETGGTRVDTKSWEPIDPPEGLRYGTHWAPDWGGETSLFEPAFDYSEAGVIVGVGMSHVEYGFRRVPYKWQGGLKALYATGSGGFGLRGDADLRFPNSRRALMLEAEATQFDVFRFYGFGNDSPELDPADTRILQDRVLVNPSYAWHIGRRPGGVPDDEPVDEEEEEDDEDTVVRPFSAERLGGPQGIFAIGPLVQWTRLQAPGDSPFADAPRNGYGQAGGRAIFELSHTDRDAAPRRGYALSAEARAFPKAWDVESGFGSVRGQVAGYLPLLGESHLAMRVGGQQNFGDVVPAFESAFIGGRHTLRGYRSDRFAGDAATWGGLELRVPLGTVELLVNGELGAFGLADAGRVYVDGESPGGWHTGFGGGLWFAAFDRAFSVAYASGESGRLYLWSGLPF